MRSRRRKNRRQSPAAIASESDIAVLLASLNSSSMFLSSFALARATSSSVKGTSAASSRPATSASAVASGSPSLGTIAKDRNMPGSASSQGLALTLVARPVSTSDSCRRPEGVSPSTWPSTCSAAVSAWAEAGMW